MEVIELKRLYKRAVEKGSRRAGRSLAPADDRLLNAALKCRHELHCSLRPGQLRTNERTSQPVQDQVFRPDLGIVRDVAELKMRNPFREAPSRARRVSRSAHLIVSGRA